MSPKTFPGPEPDRSVAPHGRGRLAEGGIPSFAKDVPNIKTGEPIFQFNGQDLSGFYTFTKEQQAGRPQQRKSFFTVKDGRFASRARNGADFSTRDEYSNYHLIAEWRGGDKALRALAQTAGHVTPGSCSHCVGPDARRGATG